MGKKWIHTILYPLVIPVALSFGRGTTPLKPISLLRQALSYRGGNSDTDSSSVMGAIEIDDVPPKPRLDLPLLPETNSESLQYLGDKRKGGKSSPPPTPKFTQPTHGLVLVDIFCPFHGQYLAHMAKTAYNVGIVNVLSTYVTGYLYIDGVREHLSDRMPLTFQSSGERKTDAIKFVDDVLVKEWAREIPFELLGIHCESDSGLGEAERLGEALGLGQANAYNEARRDKFLMNECVSKHELRTVQQKMCSSLEEALTFATELGVSKQVERFNNEDKSAAFISSINKSSGYLGRSSNIPPHMSAAGRYCIVKPPRGVASDDVFFCTTIQEVERSFNKIQGSTIFGSPSGEKHNSVLIQEFASGTEYAVDIVSKNGEHKVAALWCYDKRAWNDAPFVYFATELVDAQSEAGKAVCEYAMKTLDALGVKWGMSHNEFIVDNKGPRLVEVNCRQHNTDFAPLTTACIGYNALDMLLSSYLGDLPNLPAETQNLRLLWDKVPKTPTPDLHGAVVHLVCSVEGKIGAVNEKVLEEIQNLPSVRAMEIYEQFSKGRTVKRTVDIRSDCGWVHMIHDDEWQFKEDYDKIVELQKDMFEVAYQY